jgi:hypothetical protein
MATKKTAAKPAAAKREPTTRDVNGTTEPRCTVCDRWLAETGSLPRRRRPRQRSPARRARRAKAAPRKRAPRRPGLVAALPPHCWSDYVRGQPSRTAASKGTRERCVQVDVAVSRRADRGMFG